MAGHAAACQAPSTHVIAGQFGPSAVGQHCPHSVPIPSTVHGSPTLGSRPHQHTGSASATAQFHEPERQVQNMADPQRVPSEQVAPSVEQAEPGVSGFHGSMPLGQLVSQTHSVPVHTQPGRGSPGQQVDWSMEPGGHVQPLSVQTGRISPSVFPHSTLHSGARPPHMTPVSTALSDPASTVL